MSCRVLSDDQIKNLARAPLSPVIKTASTQDRTFCELPAMKFAASLAVLVSYIAIWSSPVRAAAIRSPDEVCYDSCQACLKPVHFDETLWNQTGLLKPCYSPRAIISLYLCLEVYCKPGAQTAGLVPLNETCQERAHTVLPPFSLISNYSAEDIAKVRRFELNETGQSHTFREVVIPSEHFFRVWWDTLVGSQIKSVNCRLNWDSRTLLPMCIGTTSSMGK
jgi:hypothetical protein